MGFCAAAYIGSLRIAIKTLESGVYTAERTHIADPAVGKGCHSCRGVFAHDFYRFFKSIPRIFYGFRTAGILGCIENMERTVLIQDRDRIGRKFIEHLWRSRYFHTILPHLREDLSPCASISVCCLCGLFAH